MLTAHRYDDDNAMIAVMTHMAVQDELWVQSAANLLSSVELSCDFVPNPTKPGAYHVVRPRPQAPVDRFEYA